MRIAWPVLYFLAALLPRLAALIHGAVYADDLVHLPSGHLASYRFINYLELALWQGVFGADFLLGAAPKIIAAIYTAAFCGVLRVSLARWGVPALVAGCVPLVIPLHPIWNTFIACSAAAVYVLSLFLIALGYFWISTNRTAAGVVAIAAGISGYQVHIGLLPALLFIELALRRESWRTALRRIAACAGAVALYGAAIAVARLAGLEAWGGRGLGAGSIRPMIDNLATLTQPLLSFWLGAPVAWKWWWLPFAALALLTAIAALRLAWMPIALPLLAASVVLPLNVIVSGARVGAAIWVAFVLAAIPLLLRAPRAAIVAALALFAAVALPVSVADTSNRVRAWAEDRALVAAIGAFWERVGVPRRDVTIVIERTDRALPPPARPIVLQNFRAVTVEDHANVQTCPEWLFARFGFRIGEGSGTWTRGGSSLLADWDNDLRARRTRVRVGAVR